MESLARDVFAPPPIRKTGGSTAATLAAEKILEATNRERVSTGIKPIIAEKRLNDAASKKISDIELKVDARNSSGVAFWKKLGFKEYSLRMRLDLRK